MSRRSPQQQPALLESSMWWCRYYVVLLPLFVACLALAGTRLVQPRFTATARLLPPQTNSNSAQILVNRTGGNSGLGMSALGAKNPSDMYAQLFVSRSVQDHAVKALDLMTHYRAGDADQARIRLSGQTTVTVGKTGLIELTVTDHDPQRSADIANALITGMYQVGQRVSQEAARRQTEFYDQLIAETRERLRAADDQLLAIETKGGLTRLKGQEEATTSTIMELKGLLVTREVDLAKMRRSATEHHPEVQRVNAEVNALRTQLQVIERPLHKQRPDILVAPQDYPELRRLVEPARREVESLTGVMHELQKAREATRIDEARDMTTIVVLDPAIAPNRRSWPVTTRAVFSAFAGGVLLALAIALAEGIWRGPYMQARRAQRRPALFASASPG